MHKVFKNKAQGCSTPLNQSNSCEDVALNLDTNKKSEFRTFAECRGFPLLFWHSGCSLMHLCPPASVAKIDITYRYLIKIRL